MPVNAPCDLRGDIMKAETATGGRREGRTTDAGDDIKIDKEFAALIPALSPDELAQLERSLLAEGCRDPLIVWKEKNILLDGHNRLSICRQHDIPGPTHQTSPELLQWA